MVEMIALSRLASLAASAASSSSCRALVSAETPLSVLLQQRELSEVEVPIGVQTNPMHHNNQQHTTNWHQGSAQPVAEAVEEEEPEGKKNNKKKKKELFKKAVRKRQDLPNIEKILALEQTPEYEGGRRRTSSATTETSVKCAVERRNERERTRVHTVNQAFTLLRRLLPCYAHAQKRVSKLKILRASIDYVHLMADAIDLLDTNDIATASTVTPASAGRRRSSLHHGASSVNKAKKPSKKGKSGGHKKCAPLLKDLDVAADTPIIRQPSSSFDKQDGETTDPMAENTEILKGITAQQSALLNSIQQQQSSISGYTAAGEAASSITSYLHSATTTNAQTSISDASCIGPLLVQQQQQQRQRHIFLDHQQQQQQQQVRALERFSSSSLSSVVQNHLLTQTHQIQQPQHDLGGTLWQQQQHSWLQQHYPTHTPAAAVASAEMVAQWYGLYGGATTIWPVRRSGLLDNNSEQHNRERRNF